MPTDAPDYVLQHQLVEVVGATVVPEAAASETSISKTQGKVTDSSQVYQTLATWTVTAARNGILYGAEFHASDFSVARFRLTIGGVVQWTDIELPLSLNVHFSAARLPAGTVVLLEGRSGDGSSVDLWGSIEGKEVG